MLLVRFVSVQGYALNEYSGGFVRTLGYFNSRAQANTFKKGILIKKKEAIRNGLV